MVSEDHTIHSRIGTCKSSAEVNISAQLWDKGIAAVLQEP